MQAQKNYLLACTRPLFSCYSMKTQKFPLWTLRSRPISVRSLLLSCLTHVPILWLDDAELRRVLQSLACAKKKVLKKLPAGRDIHDADIFKFNADFDDPRPKVHINSIQVKVSVRPSFLIFPLTRSYIVMDCVFYMLILTFLSHSPKNRSAQTNRSRTIGNSL